jgi:hypothetical protein
MYHEFRKTLFKVRASGSVDRVVSICILQKIRNIYDDATRLEATHMIYDPNLHRQMHSNNWDFISLHPGIAVKSSFE